MVDMTFSFSEYLIFAIVQLVGETCNRFDLSSPCITRSNYNHEPASLEGCGFYLLGNFLLSRYKKLML